MGYGSTAADEQKLSLPVSILRPDFFSHVGSGRFRVGSLTWVLPLYLWCWEGGRRKGEVVPGGALVLLVS